jgi:DNA sulfur modification protein DndB
MFEYVFPAISGTQAGRMYYVSMCPLRLLPKLFLFDEDELLPELRAQRRLNRARLPEIARYVLNNREDYAFSAITASVDGEMTFESLGPHVEEARMGLLHIPMAARFVINDGQHRRAAVEMALREQPDLGDESIAVVFFHDRGLERCQQLFADLNRTVVRPSRSLGVLYDHRDEMAQIVKLFVLKSDFYKSLVEMERSTLSPRSRRLVTLSAMYSATAALLHRVDRATEKLAVLAGDYWEDLARHIQEWQLVSQGRMTSGEVRQDYIHSHGTALQALGMAGNALIRAKAPWKSRLRKLRTLDWRRCNATLWEGRALVGGRVSRATQNVTLTCNAIKQHLGLSLTPEEQRIEDAFLRGGDGQG